MRLLLEIRWVQGVSLVGRRIALSLLTYLLYFTNFPTPWLAAIHLLMSGKTPPTQVAETCGKL